MTTLPIETGQKERRRPPSLGDMIVRHLVYSVGKDQAHAVTRDWCVALSLAIRDRMVDGWMTTTRRIYKSGQKRVYYLSMEFMIGRLLEDALSNMELTEEARAFFDERGLDLGEVLTSEPDPALGNGGLGRLAACFMDSMATVGVAGIGYGIRYEHGIFRQSFQDGWQLEEPEDWLVGGNAWEFERTEVVHPVNFGGYVSSDANGKPVWNPSERIMAAAFDTPIAGWKGQHVNTLRLWSARPAEVLNLSQFNQGDFVAAARQQIVAESITKVLYPGDHTPEGRELRLKQEVFFTSASLQDIVHRFLLNHENLEKLGDHVAIQLNDTHPAIAVPELVRLLEDVHGMDFRKAFDVARACLHYTNHTLLPEALERWPLELFERCLPRHMQIIRAIDDIATAEVLAAGKGIDPNVVRAIDPHYGGFVRMGNLAFIGSSHVNGVSALHTELMKKTVFKDLHTVYPDRILNQTNGITPRRWLLECNPRLSGLITETIGDGWVADLEQLKALEPYAEDAAFRERFRRVKADNKERLSVYVQEQLGVKLDPTALFDIQIKRIHEYKRQLLNILETMALYNAMKANPNGEWQPRVKIFAGKAAPSYTLAKLIIKLINDVADKINNDSALGDMLKVVFLPNYNVSSAEIIIPAADLSEQISTAGFEASGTGNMKFALNGALTIGTLDGANVEILEHVGEDNIYIFGMEAEEVAQLQSGGYQPWVRVGETPRLQDVVTQISSGFFSHGDTERFAGIVDNVLAHDYFLVAPDFDSYWSTQRWIDKDFRDQNVWQRKAVLNTANMGWFSADRTIRGYAKDIWNALP
ncbi:glycogen/starch/alpha-glucan phosphorylase [Kordiimonas marina]|uniref:glycogen/starch/alpha-glucan phosphorylase n=1 Tax=Kordiimonas marina TaxID=2872312 RepID=UPI001FF3F56C|nr:glycogen/starch/alpha-glucan phosphorylase [Kordiimonas marina]MCJ9427852.1 glycogen/starch/alpha-glucan phosphorylase [Kordiimonas marina]